MMTKHFLEQARAIGDLIKEVNDLSDYSIGYRDGVRSAYQEYLCTKRAPSLPIIHAGEETDALHGYIAGFTAARLLLI